MSIVDPFCRILGASSGAEAMRAFGRRAAGIDAPVLLLGESGTGKGVLARAIHDASGRVRGPFIAVNCAAVPESLFESEFFGHVRGAFTGAQYAHKGLFEQAQAGTLFLDEIAELPVSAQAKLLTAIEDREVRRVGGERVAAFNVRIIAATAADLSDCVIRGLFRRDLYHRLRVLHFTIPPLRARHGDTILLARHFADTYAHRYGKTSPCLTGAACAILEQWSWPGNVRELAHAVESAIITCEGLTIDEFPLDGEHRETPALAGRSRYPRKQRYCYGGSPEDERRTIDLALAKCGGNKTRAAFELGMSRNTLLNKLRRPMQSV